MNIIMSRAFHHQNNPHHQHQQHHRYPQPLSPASPHEFSDHIPFDELQLYIGTIGSGAYGIVYKAQWRGMVVAVKQSKTSNAKSFSVELKQLSRVKHDNIVRLYGASQPSNDTAYLIMEYAEGGSLNNLLHENKRQNYDLRHACSWAMQTARGVAHLHGMTPKPIMHRDLKPANLLLFSNGKILKICDFGTACHVRTQMTDNTGSAPYMAPEVFATKNYSELGDVYSWSIIFWEILARQLPYSAQQYSNPYQILWHVQQLGSRPSELEGCPDIIWNLITECWANDPDDRPTMAQVADRMQFIFKMTKSKETNQKQHNHPSLKQRPHQDQHHLQTSPQPVPSLISPSTFGSVSTSASSEATRRLKFHSKALEWLKERKKELEKLATCDKVGALGIVGEIEDLKGKQKDAELKLEQLQKSVLSTVKSCRRPGRSSGDKEEGDVAAIRCVDQRNLEK